MRGIKTQKKVLAFVRSCGHTGSLTQRYEQFGDGFS